MSKYPIGLWRIPAPEIKNGKYNSLIVDNGRFTKAIPDSKNNYLFSEAADGKVSEAIKPIALIGTLSEITNYLIENKNKKIINKISQLNEIYVGISIYKPGDRFQGVFPLQDFGVKLFSQIVSFYPEFSGLKVPAFTEAGGIPGTIKDLISTILKMKVNDDSDAKSDSILFLKISYLQEDGMTFVATNELSFASLLNSLHIGGANI